MFKIVLIAAAIGLVSCQGSLQIEDLCKPNLCKGKHITCELPQIKAKAAEGCARLFELTEENKQAILDAHNKKRNLIANGEQPGFNTASRMTTLVWDQKLADLAVLNVMRCDFAHDCHDTEEFPLSGQNINGDFGDDLNKIAYKAVDDWYAEVNQSNQTTIDQCCKSYWDNGHFTQVVTDKAMKVGCGVGVIPYKGLQMTYIVCNYSYANVQGRASYTSGATASECTTGTNPEYPALCSTAEQYD